MKVALIPSIQTHMEGAGYLRMTGSGFRRRQSSGWTALRSVAVPATGKERAGATGQNVQCARCRRPCMQMRREMERRPRIRMDILYRMIQGNLSQALCTMWRRSISEIPGSCMRG